MTTERFRFLPVQFADATRYWAKLCEGLDEPARAYGPEYQDPRPRAGEKYFVIWDDHHILAGRPCGDGPIGLLFCRWPSSTTIAFGFGLWPACTGQGLGPAVADAIYDLLFSDPAIHRVEAEVYDSNPRSLTALHGHPDRRRVHPREEGRQREAIAIGGAYYDRVLYGTLRAEWEAELSGNSRPSPDTVPA